jgi:hypothetical protein
LEKSLTSIFVNRQIADNEHRANANRNSFEEFLTVNCFLNAKNGELHQTLIATKAETRRFDERRNLIGLSPIPQAKFVKFFTIKATLMQLISFSVIR